MTLYCTVMDSYGTVQGRAIGTAELEEIGELLRAHSDWNRSHLSRHLCRQWNLLGPEGDLKDMACRNLLLKLHRAGRITLPPRQSGSPNAHRNRRIAWVEHDTAPVVARLSDIEPLQIEVAVRGTEAERLFNCLVSAYHYLGLRSTVGENCKYLFRACDGRPVACVLFGSAAWKTQARDRFIGWDQDTRRRNLQRITNNTRFLILPWVRVKCLASRALSMATARVRQDWESKYGHAVELLETFVDRSRFRGTCYQAANWIAVGHTTGRTRNSTSRAAQTTVKDVYVLPLHADFRRELCR